MPQGIHDIELPLPIGTIWEFVSVLENWVPLVPGYISHEVIHERRVTWTFTGDIGIMKKQISPEVKFTLTGINENFTGEGYFRAEALGEERTKMTGFLDITAKGLKAPMVNSILKSHVPQLTTDLAEAVASRMRE